MTTAPASTNVTAGAATNVLATITLVNGSSGSTRYIGDAVITASVSPAEPTITTLLSPSVVTFPNATTTTNITLTVTTTALTPSNTYVFTIIANTNAPDPTKVTPVTNFFTLTMAVGGPFNPLKTWSPGGVNGNWTTTGNWSPSGVPGSSNDVLFTDLGLVGTVGTVDNTVDTSLNIGSLTYGQSNNFHTTLISSTRTLTVSGTNALVAGTGTDNGDGQVTTTVTGTGGTLVVSNTAALIKISQSHPTGGSPAPPSHAQAILDLSGLDTFNANVSRMLVGVDFSIRGASGALNLARTNKLVLTPGSTAPQIDVGENNMANGSAAIGSILLLGQTNTILVDSIAVGRGKTDSAGGHLMAFNGSFANSVAWFRGTNGPNSRVGTWSIADAFGAKTSLAAPVGNAATNDFTLGTINALVDSLVVGKGASTAIANGANVIGTGALLLGSGLIDINSLQIGVSTTDAAGMGVAQVNGGTLTVNTSLELAHLATSAGTLNVSNGTLRTPGGITAGGGSSTLALDSNSTLEATNTSGTLGTVASPVTLFMVTNSTLKVAAQSLTPAVAVSALTADGANTINISSIPVLPSLPAQFPVIAYTTSDGNLASFNLGTLPAGSPAYAGYISNNVANSSIDLVITNGPVVPPLVWNGNVNSDWNTTTPNWKTNGFSAVYQQGYPIVRFDNTLTGTNFVNLTTTLTPGSLTVDNSSTDYTFGGPGKLSGATGLLKTGTRKLTLSQSGGDDFTGSVTVDGGTLQIGNGLTSGTLAADVSLAGGTALVFARSDNLTVPSAISGAGTVTQNGASTVSLTGSNTTLSGDIIVASGALRAGNPAALGTGNVIVSNAATLDVNGQAFNNNQPVTAIGAGQNSNGAIVNNSTNQTRVLRNVSLAGATTFGGSADWDIHSTANGTSDATLSTGNNNFKLTKTGTNTVTLFGVQVDGSLGDIDIQAGSLSVERNTTSLGDSGATVTVFTNATLQFQNASNTWNKIVVLKDGGTLRGINRNEFAGPITLESGIGNLLTGTGAQLILDAAIGGAGSLSKNGAGTVSLSSASTYSGSTLITGGTLALVNSGSIDSSTNITLSTGSILSLSALADPSLTLTTGRSLNGSGLIAGNVTMATGSTLSVGGTGTNSLGTLVVSNNAALQSGSVTRMEVGKTGASAVSDLLVATNISYGGTLSVTGVGGAFAANDTFKLFSGSLSGSFGSIVLPVGTTWDTSQLGVNGTIRVVSVSRPQFAPLSSTNGAPFLTFSGPAGNSYRIWASTNVAATPVPTTWILLLSNGLFSVTGTNTFIDTSATNLPARFYVISVP